MWASVNEQITDGTSSLLSSTGPIAIVVGTCSYNLEKPISIGKNSDINSLLGIGELPRRLKDMQMTMADCSIIAVKSTADITGSITPVNQLGNNPIEVLGVPLGSSEITLTVDQGGSLDTAKINLSVTGDIYLKQEGVVIQDGVLTIEELGIGILFELDAMLEKGNFWSFSTKAPTSTYLELEKAITNTLELYTPEFVFIAQEITSNEATLLGTLTEQLFEDHKPCLFLLETNLDHSKSLAEAITCKKEEFSSLESRFISIVCQSGYIKTKNGNEFRSPSGLCAGHITKAAVNQSIGATNYFAITQHEIPYNWSNVDSRALDESKFITLRTYAGLNNTFWSNGRTFGGNNSDYRFIEVVRTVFKAIRLARKASLPYIQAPGDNIGVQNLLAEIRNIINTMAESNPKEIDYFNLSTLENQDIVNNGVTITIELFGIPTIRKILLNFSFKYQQSS
ncbi:MAG: DUF2586 family protein [Brevinema sp.]